MIRQHVTSGVCGTILALAIVPPSPTGISATMLWMVRPVGGKAVDGPAVGGQAVDVPAVGGKAVDGPAVGGKAVNGPAVDDKMDRE